ncbi:MAG TPA: zincin-like metallopeptidase domain-containing protein [Flavipsychrobacter sp.]
MKTIKRNAKPRIDIYQSITDKIINLLEHVNLDEYEAPFADLAAQGIPYNPVTKKHYNGINIPFLWFYQQEKSYRSNHWASFKQWQDKGGKVRKGERGSQVVFFKTLLKSEENDQGEEETAKIPMLRLYTVFNASQVEGYEHEETPAPNTESVVTPIEAADAFCANTGAHIRQGSGGAFYRKSEDFINMPDPVDFVATKFSGPTENYYSTLFHELTHWTGHPKRLDRELVSHRKDYAKYAIEELVAELGSAFLCAQTGISQAPRADHALYIKSWLKALRNDTKFIFTASAQAGQAVEYLNSLQPK